jgi:folate-binding protein YgfZ
MSTGSLAAPTAAEMASLREGAAWALRADERLDLAGADRVRFLNNLVTCDVMALAPGRAARGFFTHAKGGVLADVDVVALADRFRLVLPAGRGAAIRAHCERYRIADRVELAERADLAALSLRGERAPELLARLGVAAPAAGERCAADLEGVAVGVRREARGREPRFELEAASPDRDALVAALTRVGATLGLVSACDAAVDCARVEDGELAWGVDYGEESFPQETGEEAAVSFTKGCYLGQEVVARIHYRGGVQRQARGLRFAGAPPALGAELLHDGRPCGRVTSLAISPRHGAIGLALVHRRAEPPAELAVAGGGTATLVALPFP